MNKTERLCELCSSKPRKPIDIFATKSENLNIASIIAQHFWFTIPDSRDSTDEIPDSRDEIHVICISCWSTVQRFHSLYVKIYNLKNDTQFEDSAIVFVDKIVKKEGKLKEESTSNDNHSLEEVKVEENYEDVEKSDIHENLPPDCCIPKEENDDVNDDDYSPAETSENDDISDEEESVKDNPISDKPAKNKNPKTEFTDEELAKYYIFDCDICGKEFKTFATVKSHYKKVHNIIGYVKCCDRKFKKRVLAIHHLKTHLNPDAFKCDVCGKLFSSKNNLKLHMKYHLPETDRPFKCPTCPNTRFALKCQLKAHMTRHGERNHICPICGKGFALKSILSAHTRQVHENSTSHICDICARVCKNKYFLERHVKVIHQGSDEPKVQCQICGAWLKHKESLKKHMLVHPDPDQEYICAECGKKAPNKRALESHVRFVHRIERKFKCELCDSAFKRAKTLTEHMTTHTGNVLYSCPYCDKTFNSSANMHAHKKKQHPVEWATNRMSGSGQPIQQS